MRTSAIVMEPAAFDRWLKGQTKAVSSPNQAAAGAAVFKNNSCGACHTFKPAGTTGKVGPDLDNLAAEAKQAGKPLEEFVRESIVNPNAYVQPGYPKNVMPPFSQLPKPELDALVQYLIKKG
jgi:cytochrome c oxidase subunit 2